MPTTIKRKFNADRSALRLSTKTGVPHTVRPVDGGYIILPVETKAAAPAKGGTKAAKAPKPAAPRKLAKPADPMAPPDFSAATHAPYRKKLARLVELAEARDIEGLRAVEIRPTSSSPKALIRYRDRVIAALTATPEG